MHGTFPCGLDLDAAKRMADEKHGSVWQRTGSGWRPWPFIEQGNAPAAAAPVAVVAEPEKAYDGQPRCKSSGTRGPCQRPAVNGEYCNKHFRKLFGHSFRRVDVGEFVCEFCEQTFSCENDCACPKREQPADTAARETCTATLPDGNRCRHHQHHQDLCGHHFRMFRGTRRITSTASYGVNPVPTNCAPKRRAASTFNDGSR